MKILKGRKEHNKNKERIKEKEKVLDELVYFQVEWINDFEYILKNKKEIKDMIKGEIKKKSLSKKGAEFLENMFYKIYFYMVKKEIKEVAVYVKGYVVIGKVDILEKNLICIAVLEERLNEYSIKIMDYIGGQIPEVIDYEKVYKELWRYEFQPLAKFILILFFFLSSVYMIYHFIIKPSFFSKKKTVVSVEKPSEMQQLSFSSDEQKEAMAIVFMQCLDLLKKKMVEISQREYVRIKEVRIGSKEDSQSVECSVVVAEQYAYPAPETKKAGDFYEREEFLSVSMDRNKFLNREREKSEFFVRKVGDFRRCLEVIARLGGEVISRSGGEVQIEVKGSLTSRQAFYFPDLLKETIKLCGWDVLKIKEYVLRVGEGTIEQSGRLEIKEVKTGGDL